MSPSSDLDAKPNVSARLLTSPAFYSSLTNGSPASP